MPNIKSTIFGIGSEVPYGYQFANLGFGNYLVVRSDFWEKFNDMKDSYKKELDDKKESYREEAMLYTTWLGFMLDILNKNGKR